MRLLALDISTTSTGYATYLIKIDKKEHERVYLKKHGHIDGAGKLAKDRFPDLIKNIICMIQEIKPDIVVVEAVFFRKSFKSIEYLLKLQGCVEAYCKLHHITFDSIETTTWRGVLKFPTNLERKEVKPDYKALSIQFARAISSKNIESDDEADAICIGLGYYYRKNKQERSILE